MFLEEILSQATSLSCELSHLFQVHWLPPGHLAQFRGTIVRKNTFKAVKMSVRD